MLSLQLKSGEYLPIGDNIAVQIFEQSGSYFRVSVKAPREIPILRGEVRERTGVRPDGLHGNRPKSPSERRHNARQLEELAERDARRKRAEEEKQAVLRELMEIADHMDALAEAHGETRGKLKDLRARLARIETADVAEDRS